MSTTITKTATQSVPILRAAQVGWSSWGQTCSGDVFNPSTGQSSPRAALFGGGDGRGRPRRLRRRAAAWSETPVVERARLMFRFPGAFGKAFRGAGRPRDARARRAAEARAEANRGIEVPSSPAAS
jgi:hypothetical protein